MGLAHEGLTVPLPEWVCCCSADNEVVGAAATHYFCGWFGKTIFMSLSHSNLEGKCVGIVAHSYEGGALCFLSACQVGAAKLGAHMHPDMVLSAIPMGKSMAAWEQDDYVTVGKYLAQGVQQVSDAGADFFVCPDNTAHLALEPVVDELPIPGLHIAQVVCHEIDRRGWHQVGLLGTKWTMHGTVYPDAMRAHGQRKLIPAEAAIQRINDAIFEELCQGVFVPETVDYFIETIKQLKEEGAECVVLGCTEIPLIIHGENSPLPVLDSTRLLAAYAVDLALSQKAVPATGWIPL